MKARSLCGFARKVPVARMLDDAFAHLECQIQSSKSGIPHFEIFDNPQGMQIVIEAVAEPLHLAVQLVFPGVREGRMADIVGQGQRFGKALVQLQDAGRGARDVAREDRLDHEAPEPGPGEDGLGEHRAALARHGRLWEQDGLTFFRAETVDWR